MGQQARGKELSKTSKHEQGSFLWLMIHYREKLLLIIWSYKSKLGYEFEELFLLFPPDSDSRFL